MNEYIFYTPQGFTQDPRGNDIENCQLLGRAFGKSKSQAMESLLNENTWIINQGYNPNEIICKALSPCDNAELKLHFLTKLLEEKQLERYENWLNTMEKS